MGHSAAKNLRLQSTPEIKPVRAAGSVTQVGAIPETIGLFQHPIPYLAPSQTLEALVGHYSGIRQSYPDLLFDVSIRYEGVGGVHEETVQLSLKPTDDLQHLAEYDIGKELHEIRETLQRMKA